MTPGIEALRALAAYADVFASPTFAVGTWGGGQADADGVIEMPYMELSDAAQRFVSEMYTVGLVHNFDWMQWAGSERGRQLLTDPDALAGASADELGRVLTAVIRGERFGDGEIESAFERGILSAVVRRAGILATGAR